MPRLFRKPIRFSNAEYLNMLYHNSFRNGWCVTLKDEIFDTYYKMITKVTHVCVNYNRAILYDEFFDTKPMLCFTDLLHHELETHRHFNTNDIHRMNSFFDEHEYCTDAIIDDIHDDHGSNLEVSMKSKRKQNQFDIIRKIVRKYNGPAQKEKAKMCKIDHVLSAEKCPLIRIIIDGLKQHNSETMHATHHVNIADLLAAYDHMISVHGLCASLSDPRLAETNESKPFEDMDHAQHTAGAHVYILSEIGGYCTSKACPILQKHIMRRRERQKEELQEDRKDGNEDHEDHGGLDEILHATLNALHCYILHEKKELFRLNRQHGKSHFITSMIDTNELKDYMKLNEHKPKPSAAGTGPELVVMPNLNFGESVLKWLDYSEHPTFDEFREEIVENPESTINQEIYLIYAQECYIKMNHRKYAQFLLEELMALKMYTDTDVFQSALRRAYWKSSNKEVKKSFYHWALLLYKAARFHSQPIPRRRQSKAPLQLHHGINQVFVLDDIRPKYNGPISTSLQKSVAHSFSGGIGLLLSIASSYANKFKFMTGIRVRWISHHKNEDEVLLMDQYLPISSTVHFDNDAKNNVDHLLFTIKSYKKEILDKDHFYVILGISFTTSWVPFIEVHHVLFDPIDKDESVRVLDVLVEKLKISSHDLLKKHQTFKSATELGDDLKIVKDKIIEVDTKRHYHEIMHCSFVLSGNTKKTQITIQSVKNNGYYMYTFNRIEDVHFIVPFNTESNTLNMYVQIEDDSNFVFLKSFDIQKRSDCKIDHVLNAIQLLNQPIIGSRELFLKTGCEITNEDSDQIKLNSTLYKRATFNPSIFVIEILIKELQIAALS
eukprot:417044_1